MGTEVGMVGQRTAAFLTLLFRSRHLAVIMDKLGADNSCGNRQYGITH